MFEERHSLCLKEDIPCVPSRTSRVFHAGHLVCSKQDISCAPSRTSLVFQAGHSLCSKQYIACVPIIISSCHHNIISSCHHIIISANQKSASQFWAKSQEKNRNRLVYPSTKNHRELNFGMSGVVFRDRSAGDAQKCTAPPNRHFTCFVMTFKILRKFHPKKTFWHRKVKCRESSETRFAKVSGRTEPCLRGKRSNGHLLRYQSTSYWGGSNVP